MWNPSLALVDASGPTRRLKSYREIGLALDRMTKSSKTSRVVFAKFWKLFLKPILRGSGHPQLTGIHGNCQDFFEQVFPLVSRTVGTASGARHPPILLQHIDRQGWQGRASSCWNLGVWKQTMIEEHPWNSISGEGILGSKPKAPKVLWNLPETVCGYKS